MATAPLSLQIPDHLTKFDVVLPCPPEQIEASLKAVSRQVAKTYARLLTEEGHQNRGKEFFFDGSWPVPPKFPSAQKVADFENRLAKRILEGVQTSHRHVVNLSCHYAPEEILRDVLAAEFGYYEFEWHQGYFPCKFKTKISLNNEEQTLRVEQWEAMS